MGLLQRLRQAYNVGRNLSEREQDFLESMKHLFDVGMQRDFNPRKLFNHSKYEAAEIIANSRYYDKLERLSFKIGRAVPYFK